MRLSRLAYFGRRRANRVVSLHGNCLPKHKIGFQNIEHHARCFAFGGVKHQIALRPTLGAFAPLGFDEAHFVNRHTKLFGHTCQVVAAIAANQFAVVLGYIEELRLGIGCPSEIWRCQQRP